MEGEVRERGKGGDQERIKESKGAEFYRAWVMAPLFLFTYLNFIYACAIFGCAVSPLLLWRLVLLWRTGPQERELQLLWSSGLAIPAARGIFLDQDRTHIPL